MIWLQNNKTFVKDNGKYDWVEVKFYLGKNGMDDEWNVSIRGTIAVYVDSKGNRVPYTHTYTTKNTLMNGYDGPITTQGRRAETECEPAESDSR